MLHTISFRNMPYHTVLTTPYCNIPYCHILPHAVLPHTTTCRTATYYHMPYCHIPHCNVPNRDCHTLESKQNREFFPRATGGSWKKSPHKIICMPPKGLGSFRTRDPRFERWKIEDGRKEGMKERSKRVRKEWRTEGSKKERKVKRTLKHLEMTVKTWECEKQSA
jgi:hypothetical protein